MKKPLKLSARSRIMSLPILSSLFFTTFKTKYLATFTLDLGVNNAPPLIFNHLRGGGERDEEERQKEGGKRKGMRKRGKKKEKRGKGWGREAKRRRKEERNEEERQKEGGKREGMRKRGKKKEKRGKG